VNFVVELLKSLKFDIVMTVVDSMSKRVHFILAYTTVTVKSIAGLFLYHV